MDDTAKLIEELAGTVQGKEANLALAVLLEVTAHVLKTSSNPQAMTDKYLKRFAERMNED